MILILWINTQYSKKATAKLPISEGLNRFLKSERVCFILILCFITISMSKLWTPIFTTVSLQMTRGRGEGGAVLGSVARLAVVAAAAVTSLALATSMMAASVSGCNEAVCASIVSKCMLLQSCKCELQPDCTCCKVDRNNKCIV